MFIFYIICFFCFLEGCEEKREMGLSYKEVGTEVFLLDGDEEKSVLALDVAANLDTIVGFLEISIIICSLQSFFILIIGHVKHYLFMYKNYIGKIVKLGFYCLVLFLR